MKTILRNTKLVMILAFLPALLSAAQAQAVDYKNVYMSSQQGAYAKPDYQVQAVSTVAPTATFQSTSAYSDQWNRDAQQSTLNSDGTVNGEAYMSENHLPGRSVRKNPGTPGGQLDPNAQQPLGDVMWPLMLCACAYLIVRATRREEKIG